MNSSEVVIHIVKRNRVAHVIKLLAKTVRQSGESSHRHSHREVLPFYETGRDVVWVWVAGNRSRLASDTLAGAVTSIIGRVTVELDKHRIVDLATERALDGLQVGSVSVCRKLYARLQAASKIVDELVRGDRVTSPVMPARNQFRIGVDGDPGPNVAVAKHAALFFWDVLFLGIAERPDFVTLKATTIEILKRCVLILQARITNLSQQAHDSILGNTRHSNRGTNRVAFNKGRNNLSALFGTKLVHRTPVLTRLSIESG